ncbi:Ferrochelatase [Caldalkalibacillus thermarum TA2.A1]|uniref:Coproporphyrin III ferrochelatase n=1 Tax=Caldalkalibacillus thermarum (strain TA2.A1) TaxID=986075 RepID=F5LB17_CALTT|nr:ferrochelatase [Caldalkalibacillus thermarum]EGL81556.1 Ferrochelatase [Caldalkalibacillus thermarum TA2.A1]QZT33848.1 ferrochelatase [Caldalkalibacillus thermarum TA2.A1]
MPSKTIGVFVMSYGTPENMEQVEEYYTHIRRGNPPSAEQLQELKDRYEAIGGLFPLRRNTNAQVEALQDKLDQLQGAAGVQFRCYQGLKHAHPLIEEGVQQMARDGIKEAIGIVLAPHYSIMSVGSYVKRAQAEADKAGIAMRCVKDYHLHPLLIEAWAERVQDTLAQFAPDVQNRVRIIFTAHSLPEKIKEMNDPYVEQLLETSRAIMAHTGLANQWQFAWQSAGQTPVPWLGPDILDVLRQLRQDENVEHVMICPIGFVSDHLEILYDIDIEAQNVARELGIELKRPPSLNTDPRYIEVLADMVLRAYQGER